MRQILEERNILISADTGTQKESEQTFPPVYYPVIPLHKVHCSSKLSEKICFLVSLGLHF
jgi:hypothetical protein